MITSGDIVSAAREWLGTPYRHQHSTRGAGCDCLGLVRGVYRDVIGSEPESPPNYSPSWGEADNHEVLLIAAARHLIKVTPGGMSPGDVVIFRMDRRAIAKHCGIVVSDTHMIHAYQGAGRVEESALVPWWRSRIAGVFRFPGVD